MTQERATSIARAPERTLARLLSIAKRAAAATPGPWGYVRPSGVICGPDASEVAHCLHDPDAIFIAHARDDLPWLLDQLQAGRPADLSLDGRLLDRVLLLLAAIRVVNEELNRLPWQGDGLHGFVAEGLDRDQARWVGQVVEEVASALDPEVLGLKDGDS
jgi:hypothetical protein